MKDNNSQNNNTSNAIANQTLQKKSEGASLEPPTTKLSFVSAINQPIQKVKERRNAASSLKGFLEPKEAAANNPLNADSFTDKDVNQPAKLFGLGEDLETITKDSDKAEITRQIETLMKNVVEATEAYKKLILSTIDGIGGAENGDKGFAHVNKELQGTIDKATGRMEGKTLGGLTDVLRGTIKCKTMADLKDIEKRLDNSSILAFEQTENKTQKKNGFEKTTKKTAGDMVGYGDLKYMIPIVFSEINGEKQWLYAEIQVMTIGMNKNKLDDGGHQFYDITREKELITEGMYTGSYRVKSTESAKKGIEEVLSRGLLNKHVNQSTLKTLIPKLNQIAQGQQTILSKKEFEELEYAGEIIYRKERIEGNLLAQRKDPK